MQVLPTELPGVVLIEPRVYTDLRGSFLEVFHRERYAAAGIPVDFAQDNLSRSCHAAVRGLHFQRVHAQGKLIQAVRGEIFDVAVDVRRSSPTFGRWTGQYLSGDNRRQLYIPPGFAHGFCTLSDAADVLYKCTDLYYPEHERTLLWNDPAVGIAWPLDRLRTAPVLSAKDFAGTPLSELECP